MNVKTILTDLTKTASVSGFEGDIAENLKKRMEAFCDEVYVNRFNSLICIKKSNNKNAKKLMLEAHLDQIGLMVTEIDEMGFIKFIPVGGVDKRILPGSEVYILGKEKIYGIIGMRPPHLKEKSEKDATADVDELLIDTGYTKDEVLQKVSVGDSIIFKSPVTELMGNNVCGASLDNRAGVASLMLLAEETENSKYDLYFVFTSEEELGLHGAYSASKEISPDYAIIVDVTHGMTNDTKDEAGVFKTGSGAIICKSPTLSGEVSKRLIELAQKNHIKYDIEVASGNTGTTAWAVQKSCGNCKTALISVPLKYMHTSVETLNTDDIEAVSKLLKCALEEGIENA